MPAEGKKRVRGLRAAVEIGERVFLRRPTARDEAEFLELLRVSRSFHRRWEPLPPRGLPAVCPQRFAMFRKRSELNERLLICRLEDGALAGTISLSQIVRGPFQSAFLGYWIGAPFQRRGYMSEAVSLILRHAFRTLKLHRVEANIIPSNAASIGLIRRAGFRSEGVARRYLKIAGRWQDHEHWVVLAEEWRGRRKAARRKKA